MEAQDALVDWRRDSLLYVAGADCFWAVISLCILLFSSSWFKIEPTVADSVKQCDEGDNISMKNRTFRKFCALLLASLTVFTVSCGIPLPGSEGSSEKGDDARESVAEGKSFAEAHDAFQTTLVREETDDSAIPEPPEGVFDLVEYSSKVGNLAAYVSSDPGDGQKHPLIIWVVGGWGNGIDDFPWTYPEWDNDQTGSAFWRSGVLTMYPSFRGGNGNPGKFEALFGEVDDIVSAYEYAASLPYVDPNRIYLGGHSTGGTRALLAAEYTDKFRAVFCFGAVDDIKYHNNSQFTFDTGKEEEYIMRSPIHWLEDIKTPTFLIEGRDGNGSNLERMRDATDNENLHCYVLEGADHFAPLAPITPLLAEKILADTGAESNISITQEELESAMAGEPEIPLPVMTEYEEEALGMTFSCPYLWVMEDISEDGSFSISFYSPYEGENVWDMSNMYLDIYGAYEGDFLQELSDSLAERGFEIQRSEINGYPMMDAIGMWEEPGEETFRNRIVMIQVADEYVGFTFYIHEDFGTDADELFQSIVDTIEFGGDSQPEGEETEEAE